MIQCEICLTEYQEGNFDLHRETCVLRLVFRCSICNEDYVSREGLWNHLDLHETLDDSKEFHYQELKAKHKLYQCALCNDQRAYSEDSYRMHLNNIHENRECQNQMPVLDLNDLPEEPASFQVEHMAFDDKRLEQTQVVRTTEARDGLDNRMVEELPVDQSVDADSNINKKSALSTTVSKRGKNLRSRLARDNPKNGLSQKASHFRDKVPKTNPRNTKHSCLTCGEVFSCKDDLLAHNRKCKQWIWLCKLCGRSFGWFKSIIKHNEINHPKNGSSETIQFVPKQTNRKYVRRTNTAEEATATALDARGQAIMGVGKSGPNTGSMSEAEDNASKDGQATSVGTSEKQVASTKRKTSAFCKVCNITLQNYRKFVHHRMMKHTEPRFECPHCSIRFHVKEICKSHAVSCEKRKHSCESCGERFIHKSSLERHKIKIHGNAIVGSGGDTEEHNSSEQMDIAQAIITCTICRIKFKSADELMKHKLTCLKPVKGPNDSQVSAKQGDETSHAILSPDDIKLEITVEDTELQDYQYQSSNEYSGSSDAPALHPRGRKLKQVRTKTAQDLDEGITVKEELITNEGGISTEHQVTAKSTKSRTKQELICTICELRFNNMQRLVYHKTVCHTEPRYECSRCHKKFHYSSLLRYHAKRCSRRRCNKCEITFSGRDQLDKHNIEKHPEPKGDEDSRPDAKRWGPTVRNEAGDLVFPCPICDLTFDKRHSRRYHVLIKHMEPQHKCSVCQKKYHVEGDLRRHEKICRQLRCYECDMVFTSRVLYDEHYVHKHGSKPKNSRRPKVPRAKATPGLNNGNIVGEVLSENGEEISSQSSDTAESSKSRSEQGIFCLICGLSFRAIHSLKYHRIVSHSKPQYECSLCHRKFYFLSALRHHKKRCSALQCYECCIRFATRDQLGVHNIEKHPQDSESKSYKVPPEDDIKPEIGNEQATATNPVSLRRIRYGPSVHNEAGDLVWPCLICKRTFDKNINRRTHVIRCHTEPKHKCPLCEKGFHFKTDLRRHENSCSLTSLIKPISKKHLQDDKSKNIEATDDATLGKEVRAEDRNDTLKSLERQNEPLVDQTASREVYPCSICGRIYGTKQHVDFHMVVSHTDGSLKLSKGVSSELSGKITP